MHRGDLMLLFKITCSGKLPFPSVDTTMGEKYYIFMYDKKTAYKQYILAAVRGLLLC
jgi:hypothetical protein